MDDELTPREEIAATRLAALAVDPTPAEVAHIMAAVRAAPGPARSTSRLSFRSRLRLAGIAAAATAVLTSAAVMASNEALPGGPGYGVRNLVEQGRVQVAGPVEKEHLRASFAADRIRQARHGANHDQAQELLNDSRRYINDAHTDLDQVGADDRGSIRQELDQVEHDQGGAERDVKSPQDPAGPGTPNQDHSGTTGPGGASGSPGTDAPGTQATPGGQVTDGN